MPSPAASAAASAPGTPARRVDDAENDADNEVPASASPGSPRPRATDDTPAVAAALLARFRETAEARVAELVRWGQVS